MAKSSRKTEGHTFFLLGDFNAKIMADPGIPRHVGPNIFRSTTPLGNHSAEVLENWDLFLDFLIQHDLVAINTLKAGPPTTQITYRTPGQPNFQPPWEEHRFCPNRLYFCPNPDTENDFSEATPNPGLDYDSDHLPIEATIRIHWRFGPQPRPNPTIRHTRICTPDQRTEYNKQIENHHLTWANVRDIIGKNGRSKHVEPDPRK